MSNKMTFEQSQLTPVFTTNKTNANSLVPLRKEKKNKNEQQTIIQFFFPVFRKKTTIEAYKVLRKNFKKEAKAVTKISGALLEFSVQ